MHTPLTLANEPEPSTALTSTAELTATATVTPTATATVTPTYYAAPSPVVYHLVREQVEPVPRSTVEDGALVLPGSLIIPPGRYTFAGDAYDLHEEGLYRLLDPWNGNQQRIVYAGNVDILLSSVSWIVSHGHSDGFKSNRALSDKALRSKVFVACGTVSRWARGILGSIGVNSRVVGSFSRETQNGYDDGHLLLEVFRNEYGKWVLYDLDNNAYFMRQGVPLNLMEFADAVPSDDYEIRYLAADTKVDISNFKDLSNGYDYGFLMEYISTTEAALRRWYKRVMQLPLVNNYYYISDVGKSYVLNGGYIYLEREQFIDTFYP